ncbi:MAG: serine/threonine-protein kinase, partial [Thermoleophilaceae bacterium]
MSALSGGGTLLGRYRIVRRLGAGGMATVFLAEDERLRRQVAVKRLHAESAEAMAQRFEREARVGASLNHPNIVAVYDTDTDAEGVVIVMEYVEGETLAAALRRGPLEPRQALAVIGDVAAALDHAHRAGVIHRDVKPANVLLGGGDFVKLADLGIAQAAEQTHLTATGTVLGTASYMAPEQLEGGGVGPEADTYALAAVAYEALSGRRAREGATPVAIAHSVTSEPPPDLRRAWPAAPPGAARALARAMDRDPAARQRSPGEVGGELSEAVGGGLLTPPTASTEPMTAPKPEP